MATREHLQYDSRLYLCILHCTYKCYLPYIALQNLTTKLDRRGARLVGARSGFQARPRQPGAISNSAIPKEARQWALTKEAVQLSICVRANGSGIDREPEDDENDELAAIDFMA